MRSDTDDQGTPPYQRGDFQRIQSIPASEPLYYEFGPFRLDLSQRLLCRDGKARQLPARKFELLRLLVSHAGQVVRKDDIFKQIWPNRFIDESNLSQNILYLRQLIEDDPQTPRYILTIPGAGYMFFAASVPAETASASPLSFVSPAPLAPPWRDRAVKIMVLVLTFTAIGLFLWVLRRIDKPAVKAGLVTRPFITINGDKGALSFSPNGASLAFTSIEGGSGTYALYVRSMSDERSLQLTANSAPAARIAWSPDGRQIAFLRQIVSGAPQQQVFIIPATGGGEELVGEAVGGLDWSPNGQSLAITDRPEPEAAPVIYLLSVDGKTRKQLTTLPPGSESFDHDPRFSPDGRSVAFIREHSPFNSDILLLDIVNGKLVELARKQADVRSLQWSVDGRELLFLSRQSGSSRIWSLPIKKTEPLPVTSVWPGTDNFAISPRDGQLVLSCLDTTEKISILGQREEGSRPLCEIRSTERDASPQFSPDGRQIAFLSDRTGHEEVWITDPECSYQTKLTNLQQAGLGRPRWSPDGKRIAFHRYVGDQTDIFLVEVIGGQLRQLTDHPAPDSNPTWSADGRWIYFTSRRENSSGLRRGDHLWRVSVDGGPATQLSINNAHDSWESTDGQTLLFTHQSVLYEKNLATGEERRIEELVGQPFGPNWAPAAGGVYFFNQRNESGMSCVNFFDLRSRRLRQVTCLDAAHYGPTYQRSLPGFSISPDQRVMALSLEYTQGGEISIMSNWR